MSSSYEKMHQVTSFGFSARWRKQFINQINPALKNATKVADLMCGLGETWKFIKQVNPTCELTAVDFSDNMLAIAHVKNNTYFENAIKLIQTDILDNNLPSDYFDCVICSFGLKTLENSQIILLAKEIKRILKPNGWFSLVEVSVPSSYMLRKLYMSYLKHIIPILAKMYLGSSKEYAMLGIYTEKFENCKISYEIFKQEGLKTHYHQYFYGCATGIFGHKLA